MDTIRAAWRRVRTSDFVGKVAMTFATRVLLIGVGVTTAVVVARILGPAGRGLYAVAVAVGGIGVQFANLGLHSSNTYYVSRNRDLLPPLVGNTLVVSFLLGGAGVCAAWIVFSIWPRIAPLHGPLLALALIWIPLGLGYMLLQNLLLGIQEVRAYNKIELTTQTLVICFIGLVAAARVVRVETVFAASLAALTISFSWALVRIRPHLQRFPRPDLAVFKENLRYGLRAYFGALFAFLVLRLNVVMVKYLLGATDAGYYSVASTTGDMVCMLPIAISTILFPKLSAMTGVREKWAFTRRVAAFSGLAMVVLTATAAALAKPVIGLFFGAAFLPAAPAFVWLAPGMIAWSLTGVISAFVASEYIPIQVPFLYFVMSVVNVGLGLHLIPIYGIIGASMASTVSYTCCLAGILAIARSQRRKREQCETPSP